MAVDLVTPRERLSEIYADNLPIDFSYQYDSSPIPKPAEYSDLEAVRRQNYPPNEPPNEKEQSQSRRICGLRVVTFWLALALVVVIILAAVGGGVGGALANNNSSKSAARYAKNSSARTEWDTELKLLKQNYDNNGDRYWHRVCGFFHRSKLRICTTLLHK